MTVDLSVWLLSAVCLILFAAMLVQDAHARRARGKTQRLRAEVETLRRDLAVVQQDFDALCSGATGIGAHLSRVDRQLIRLNERQDQLDLRDSAQREYDQALRLIRSGAGIDEIVSQCHLARAEAELLARLHPPADARSGMRSVA